MDLLRLPVLLAFLHSPFTIAQHLVVPWSDQKFGPDGPWQAVTVRVGAKEDSTSNPTQLNLYPGGKYHSVALSPDFCQQQPGPLCESGGTWEPETITSGIAFTPDFISPAAGINVPGIRINGIGLTIGSSPRNEKTIFDTSIGSASEGNVTYPNGVVTAPLGALSLGAPETEQTFSRGSSPAINVSMFAGKLWENGELSSYSYGLHIGSAAFNYPGSLSFGGYNKGRIIEPVTRTNGDNNAITLLDIGIGTEFGDSPFEFTERDNLLSNRGDGVIVLPDPLAPYLSLPAATCDALASLLPVTFDETLKYYLWNIEDPQFERIVTSPAYLSFTFPPPPGKAGADQYVKIKVPFPLLNLTLEAPITDTPRQYFPCVPYDASPPVLGRAFLQAAFIGTNWNRNTTWLAQAPGPGFFRNGLGDLPTDIEDGEIMITGLEGPNLFNASWEGHWTPINDPNKPDVPGTPPNEDPSSQSSSGLSTGAKAGIGIGAALGALALLAGVFILWRRRSNHKHRAAESEKLVAPVSGQESELHTYPGPAEMAASPQEYQKTRYANMGAAPAQEMPGNEQASPVEMGDTTSPR